MELSTKARIRFFAVCFIEFYLGTEIQLVLPNDGETIESCSTLWSLSNTFSYILFLVACFDLYRGLIIKDEVI